MSHNPAAMAAYKRLTQHFGLRAHQRDQLDALERSTDPDQNTTFWTALAAAARDDWRRAQDELERGGILQPGLVLGSDNQLHAVNAYYDGECAYAWSCYCGAAETDAPGLDTATEWSVLHLDAVDALVSA